MGEAAVRDRARCGAGCEGAGCGGAAWGGGAWQKAHLLSEEPPECSPRASRGRHRHAHRPCRPSSCRRCHPKLNVIYACTESVKQEGQVVTLALDGKSGALRELCPPVGAGGTSTCFLTIHHGCRRMLLVRHPRLQLSA